MKIAMLAPVEEQVPPKKYGGTELVVYNLTEELLKLGHEVTLLATGDSKTNAKLVPIFPKAIRVLKKSKDVNIRNSLKYVGAGKVASYLKKHAKNFDIIHNHIGWMFLPFVDLLDTPTVTTFHGFLKVPYQNEIYQSYRQVNYISISKSQRKFSTAKLNFIGNVYNGIDVSRFSFFGRPENYFAFFGRICPEKGALEAIRIAKQAKVRLVMAGKVDPVDQEFFLEKIKPLLDGKQIKFIGEIGHDDKVKFLGKAKALLAPIQWEEPFGLFFVEAMVCGTPVITMDRGSAREVIKDKETGYIVRTLGQAVEAIGKIGKINREKCRQHVLKNFPSKKMAVEYVGVYEKVLARNRKINHQ